MIFKKGYTLVEILVALTIIGLIFSFGYVSFRDFSRRQQLSGIAKQMQGDLRLAQQEALSGQKPTSGCGTLLGHSFTVLAGGTEYQVSTSCPGGIEILEKSVVLPTDMTISPAPSSVLFKVLGQGTDISTDQIWTISQVGTGNTIEIKITPGGEIE